MKQQLSINSLIPFYHQNSFEVVQLSETILPTKMIWEATIKHQLFQTILPAK
jgi:hypothetical protein